MTIALRRIDHVVLTVADLEATIAFYERVLGMRHVVFGERHALHFGALGSMTSIYFGDPDANLVEVSVYDPSPSSTRSFSPPE